MFTIGDEVKIVNSSSNDGEFIFCSAMKITLGYEFVITHVNPIGFRIKWNPYKNNYWFPNSCAVLVEDKYRFYKNLLRKKIC